MRDPALRSAPFESRDIRLSLAFIFSIDNHPFLSHDIRPGLALNFSVF